MSYGIVMTEIGSSKLNPVVVQTGYLNSTYTWYFRIIHLPFCICSSGQEGQFDTFYSAAGLSFFCLAP